jgi:hypothetical protein
MLPRRRCAVREEGKSGIETATEVFPTPEIKKAYLLFILFYSNLLDKAWYAYSILG